MPLTRSRLVLVLTCRGYLNALNRENVTPVWDMLASATPDHIVTAEGEQCVIDGDTKLIQS